MDPNAALEAFRARIAEAEQAPTLARANVCYELAAGHMEALDEWLSKGGCLPDVWAKGWDRAVARASAGARS